MQPESPAPVTTGWSLWGLASAWCQIKVTATSFHHISFFQLTRRTWCILRPVSRTSKKTHTHARARAREREREKERVPKWKGESTTLPRFSVTPYRAVLIAYKISSVTQVILIRNGAFTTSTRSNTHTALDECRPEKAESTFTKLFSQS